MFNKNDEFEVNIIDYGRDGEGIAKVDNFTLFIPGAMKGERCKVHVTKVNKNFGFAKLIEVIEKSKERCSPDCKSFPRCGGCALRHMTYKETLKIKKYIVENLANKMLNQNVKVNDCVDCENNKYYRNKAIYPVSKDGVVGTFASRSHYVLPLNDCKIQSKISQNIARHITTNWKGSFYDEETNKGELRNIMIRTGINTDEVMVVVVLNGDELKFNVDELLEHYPQIKTIIINKQTANTNVILSRNNIIVYGEGYIHDKIGDNIFKISPNSFFQINNEQTEKFYKLAIDNLNLNKDDIVCDLYCGIGTIGISIANKVKKVYGIEIVEEAIIDAQENAALNNIDNIEFIQGDCEQAFKELLEKDIVPTAIIVDPPRSGLDETTVNNLNKLKLEKLSYISCNPATLMRDLHMLEDTYKITSLTPVDNFCYSSSIETVATLERK